MGMDAVASVFYGYKDSYCHRGEDYLPEAIVSLVRCSEEQFLAAKGSEQRFDWDDCPKLLDLNKINSADVEKYKEMLEQACFALDMNFSESRCGWFVVCDMR